MKLGEYELNRIYNEDCYTAIKKIPDKSVDLIVTDPPYEIGEGGMTGLFKWKGRSQVYMSEILDNDFGKGFDFSLLDEWYRVMKKTNIYIWCNKEQIPTYLNYFVKEKKCNFEIFVWHKENVPPFTCGHYLKDKEYCLFFWESGVYLKGNFETMKTVLEQKINIQDKKLYGHPTIKPIEFIKNHINNSSKDGGIILDTFMGSGTTAVACKELGRNFIGFEINPTYYQIACDRLNGLTKEDREKRELGQMSLF